MSDAGRDAPVPMADFLSSLAVRALGVARTARPRLPSRFEGAEPWPAETAGAPLPPALPPDPRPLVWERAHAAPARPEAPAPPGAEPPAAQPAPRVGPHEPLATPPPAPAPPPRPASRSATEPVALARAPARRHRGEVNPVWPAPPAPPVAREPAVPPPTPGAASASPAGPAALLEPVPEAAAEAPVAPPSAEVTAPPIARPAALDPSGKVERAGANLGELGRAVPGALPSRAARRHPARGPDSVVQVTIERIEVRVAPEPTGASAPPRPAPALSLDEYLRQRGGGAR